MRRSDAFGIVVAALGTAAVPTRVLAATTSVLSSLRFAVALGRGLVIGAAFDSPELIVDNGTSTSTTRAFIPRAPDAATSWQRVSVPASAPVTNAVAPPGSDVVYGSMPDRVTAMCAGERGVYVAMVAFPARPYLVFYHADSGRFWARTLPPSQPVVALFTQPGQLFYSPAADPQLPAMHVIDTVTI